MLKGKVALVTGGSRGIGAAIALRLAKAGADVAILYAGNSQAAQATCADIEAQGVRALAVQCDVKDFEAVKAAVDQVVARFGGVDILVNNAGITRDKLSMRMSEEEFDQVIATNLKGAFNTIRHVSPLMMKKRFGRIINISSVSGLMGNPGQANYAAAKAGMIGLTKTIAKELAGRNVTCNASAPGFIKTDMTGAMNEKVLEEAVKQIPMKRMGEPEEIAGLCAFLCSDEAGYITGSVIQVDGGLYM